MKTNAWTLMSALALSLVACSDLPPRFESASQRPLKPGEAATLVRLPSFNDRNWFSHIVVSNEHVFFASPWDGLYRVPKYGGPVVAAERNDSEVIDGLATNGTDVFLFGMTFGAGAASPLTIRRRGENEQGPSHLIARGDFGGFGSNLVRNFALDGNDLFLVHTVGPVMMPSGRQAAAIDRYSVNGGAGPTRVLAYDDVFATPSWVPAGDGTIAFTTCTESGCSVSQTTSEGAPRELMRTDDWGVRLAAADANGFYLHTTKGIGFLPRDGSPPRTLANIPVHMLVVDDTKLYAVDYSSETPKIISVTLDTGAVTVLGEGDQFSFGIWDIGQDTDNVFLLRAGYEILRLPKVRAQP